MTTMYTTQRRANPVKGLVLDRPPWEVDAKSLVVAQNVRTRNGAIQSIGGSSLITTAADASQVSYIGLSTFFNDLQVGVVGTNNHLHTVNGGVLQPLNPVAFGAAAGDPWETAMMLGRAYFLTPGLTIKYYDGSLLNDLVATAGKGVVPQGYTMTDFYNHLIVGNILSPAIDQQSFIGGGRGDDQFWDLVDLTQEARSFLVPLGNDPILCIRKLGDYLIIYKTFSIHQVTYSPGTSEVYGVEAMRSRTGTVGTQAVVYVPGQLQSQDQHYFVGQDNIYRNDGSIVAIGDRVWDDFRAKVRADAWSKIIGWYHEIMNEVYFGFMSTNNSGLTPDMALVYDVKNDCFYYRDWPFTAGGYLLNSGSGQSWEDRPGSWDDPSNAGIPWVTPSGLRNEAPYVGGATGQLYQYEAKSASDFDAQIQTGLWDFDDDMRVKRVNGLRLDVQGVTADTPLEVWSRGLFEIDEYYTTPFRQVATVTGGSRVNFCITGRWMDFQFIQRAGGWFKLASWEPIFRNRGER